MAVNVSFQSTVLELNVAAELQLTMCEHKVSLAKQQFVVIHTIRHTEIPAFLDSLVTNTHSVKILYPHKIASRYIFART